jgi:hypothetical protein
MEKEAKSVLSVLVDVANKFRADRYLLDGNFYVRVNPGSHETFDLYDSLRPLYATLGTFCRSLSVDMVPPFLTADHLEEIDDILYNERKVFSPFVGVGGRADTCSDTCSDTESAGEGGMEEGNAEALEEDYQHHQEINYFSNDEGAEEGAEEGS